MKNKAGWKPISYETISEIMSDYNAGVLRNRIMRKHEIPKGQFYHIVKEYALQKLQKEELSAFLTN